MQRLKTLHVCNIANVAYGNCKILRGDGWPVRLACHDINHLMSQPEWDDQDLDIANFPDENNFFNSLKPLQLTRPDWYERDDIQYHPASFVGRISKLAPSRLKELLRPLYQKLFYAKPDGWALPPDTAQTQESDVLKFSPHVNWLTGKCQDEDVIFAYALSPVYAMLKGDKPYVAVEIGTMRELPFEDTANGRMLALAYQKADHILITNPDVKAQAEALGLTRFSFCPHPVDEQRFKPQINPDVREHYASMFDECDVIGVAPARQNWQIKGNFKYLDALAELRHQRQIKACLVIPAWGQDIEKSKAYAAEKKITQYIKWLPPLTESALIELYSNLDFVLDQFELGVFGLITPKALACGAVVITSYNENVHEWCFEQHPPVLAADAADGIASAIEHVARNNTSTLRAMARAWFMSHHSKAVVLERLKSAAVSAIEHRVNNEKIASR